MEALFTDLKYCLRILRKSPGFTITAVAALALGIGATTAIFSIIDTVILKPLPIVDPDRFVTLTTLGGGGDVSSPAKFEYWRSLSSVLEQVSAFHSGIMNFSNGHAVQQVRSLAASADLFRCWGIGIARGRSFAAEEDLPNGPRVVVIGTNFWKQRFGGDPQITGKTLVLNDELYTVIGVAADSPVLLEIGPVPEVYVPLQFDPDTRDHGDFFRVVARLKPGVSLEQANARLRVAASEFRVKYPNVLSPVESFIAKTFRESFVGEVRSLLLLLSAASVLVLLIACANVANLLLTRASARRREIAIRAAIGSSRGRLIRQFLTESILLAMGGGALGTWLGYAGLRALLTLNTADLPMVGENGAAVTIDWRVMAFAIGVSLVTAIVFGVAPALKGSREDLTAVLKDGGRQAGGSARQNKVRAVLVISEVSAAVTLLIASTLLIRTIVAMYTVHRGFDTNHVVTMRTLLAGPKHRKSSGIAETIRTGLEHIRAVPGVLNASATWCCVPLQGSADMDFQISGRAAAAPLEAGWSTVSPGFFEVFKIPLKKGRTFTERDDGKSTAVAVINESMARKYWGNADPLNARIVVGRSAKPELKNEPERQIIGIVGDVRDEGLDSSPRPILYEPQAQVPDQASALLNRNEAMSWAVRTQGQPRSLTPAIVESLHQATGLPITEVRSMDETVSLSTARQRFNALLMALFGGSALLLAAIGIYGMMAYSVEQRTREIGIRMALGAQSKQVRNLVVREGMKLTLSGIAVGVVTAWCTSRVMESFLFGVQARDPLVFGAIPMILIAVALIAVWLPANQASRVNPVESLRSE